MPIMEFKQKKITIGMVHVWNQHNSVNQLQSVKVKLLSHVRLSVTPRTVAYQAPLFMGFSRQEYWSGLLFPSI